MKVKTHSLPNGVGKTVLISSIKPISGGVPQMTRFVMNCLRQQGFKIRLAYYEPYSLTPEKSVPISRFLKALVSKPDQPGNRPDTETAEFDAVPATGIGCWLPEFEFTNYYLSKHWQTQIDLCDYHICVSGSNLAGLPFTQSKQRFLAWVATPWLEDRLHRVSEFPWYRRIFDVVFVRPFCSFYEQRINAAGNIVALSQYTQKMMNKKSSKPIERVMPMPIDTQHFRPLDQQPEMDELKIGFVGRFQDPRKNTNLLIEAFAKCVETNSRLKLILVGDSLNEELSALTHALGISDKVEVIEHLPNEELVGLLQELSVFVVPSYQEGLCIAALEAMSCGVPVVSTRCGGPEDYIESGKNGILVESNVADMQLAISQIIEDADALNEYSRRARQTIEEQFSLHVTQQKFWRYFSEAFPESTDRTSK